MAHYSQQNRASARKNIPPNTAWKRITSPGSIRTSIVHTSGQITALTLRTLDAAPLLENMPQDAVEQIVGECWVSRKRPVMAIPARALLQCTKKLWHARDQVFRRAWLRRRYSQSDRYNPAIIIAFHKYNRGHLAVILIGFIYTINKRALQCTQQASLNRPWSARGFAALAGHEPWSGRLRLPNT